MLRYHRAFNLAPHQVSISRALNSRTLVPAVEEAIEKAWNNALQRPGIRLFDGPMCRLESWTATDDHLDLILSSSSYKSFFGTNMSHPEFADLHGTEVMANPVGVSPALCTADGFLMLGRRNSSMAYYPERVHPFSGCMEPEDADLFSAVRRELSEELSLGDTEILDLRCTGIVEDLALRQSEFIFAIRSSRTRAQIESQIDGEEHHSSWSIPATAGAIEDCIERGEELTPVAIGALMLWGRVHSGNDWFDRVVNRKTGILSQG